jgi:hypothetical protein
VRKESYTELGVISSSIDIPVVLAWKKSMSHNESQSVTILGSCMIHILRRMTHALYFTILWSQ